jgi:hypothetical protein
MAQQIYIVLHMPKTAGTTLAENFKLNFGRDGWLYNTLEREAGLYWRVGAQEWNDGALDDFLGYYVAHNVTSRTRCIFGHTVFPGIHRFLSPQINPLYITFLRDPVERCISFYYYLKGNSNVRHEWPAEIIRESWSLQEWIEKGTPRVLINNGQVRHLLLDLKSLDNIYTNGVTPPQDMTREHLEEAKRRLRQFWFVGLTENFADDSYYLYGKLGFRRFHPEAVVNASSHKQQVTLGTRQLIAEMNSLDIELYEYARTLRAHFLRDHGYNFQYNRRKALLLRSLYNSNRLCSLARLAVRIKRGLMP